MFAGKGSNMREKTFLTSLLLVLIVLPIFSCVFDFNLENESNCKAQATNEMVPVLFIEDNIPIRNYSIISQWQNSYDSTLDVFVVNEFAYLADKEGGLVILDLTNLTDPKEIGRYRVAEDIVGAVNLFVEDAFAFVANDVDGARIFDISNKTDPQLESEYHDELYYWDVYTDSNYAYFSTIGDGLEIFDVSDKSNPIEIAQYNSGGFIWSIWGSENYLFTADLTFGLEVLNITEKTSPTKIGSYNDLIGQPYSIIVEDDFAFVAEGNEGLEIINISSIDSPIEICQYSGGNSIVDVEYFNETIFLADKYDGLIILDYTNKTQPTEIGSYNVEGDVWNVFFDGEYAFLANGHDGLVILGLDSDNDDLSDYLETEVYFTDPFDPDSDQDGFFDGFEVKHGTDPLDPDDYPEETTTPTNEGMLISGFVSFSLVILMAATVILLSERRNKFLKQ